MEFMYDVDPSEKMEDADYLLIRRDEYNDASFPLPDNIRSLHRTYENSTYIIFTK